MSCAMAGLEFGCSHASLASLMMARNVSVGVAGGFRSAMAVLQCSPPKVEIDESLRAVFAEPFNLIGVARRQHVEAAGRKRRQVAYRGDPIDPFVTIGL